MSSIMEISDEDLDGNAVSDFSDEEQQERTIARLEAALAEDDDVSYINSETGSLISRYLPGSSTDAATQERDKINAAIGLNKQLDEKYKRLENVLSNRLVECRQRLKDLHETLVTGDKQERQETFRYINCGKPYFKDKSNFPAPDNEDTKIMAESHMYDFSEITSVPGWTVKDKCSLNNLLLKLSIDIKKKELTSKIAKLKREGKDKPRKVLEKEIDTVNRQITNLNKKTLKDIALPIDQDYDWELVANKLNRRHSAAEYKSLWKVFLHPSINKSIWDKNEHARLQAIAQKHKYQDWEAIATELNSGRTGYQCFVYYRTNMSNTFTGKKWTKEEEEYLRRLIDYYKEDEYIPWGKVASSMENRTKIQIYNKYFRLVEKRKGRFLPEEDAVILTCYDKFGPNFKKIAEYLPGRSASQIRVRYQVLAKKRISTVWTLEEDKKLLQLVSNADSLTNYSSLTKHFNGKTRVHLRARYGTLKNWMKTHPNLSLKHAPRRGARRLGHGCATDNLNKATEKLRKRIESEIEIKKSTKITKDSPLEVIEDAIIANLVTEHAKLEDERKVEVYNDDEVLVLDTESVVSLLDLNVTNLQKLIILLRGKLNQSLFKNSAYADQYPALLDPQQEVNLFKVKSYSKKGTTQIKVNNAPDIWGNNVLGSLTYVLPPNYATLTGCRKLMAHVNSKQGKKEVNSSQGQPFHINTLIRRNPYVKEQLFLLMERFNTLFLFPMLLSNEGPDKVGKLSKEDKERLRTGEVPNFNFSPVKGIPPSFAIPVTTNRHQGRTKRTKEEVEAGPSREDTSIDLDEYDEDQKDKLCVQKVVVNDNIRFIAETGVKRDSKRYLYN